MTIKIADFGSSHIMQGTRTLSSEVKSMRGSPYWMSPEHIRGVGCGRKADIWRVDAREAHLMHCDA